MRGGPQGVAPYTVVALLAIQLTFISRTTHQPTGCRYHHNLKEASDELQEVLVPHAWPYVLLRGTLCFKSHLLVALGVRTPVPFL